MDKYKLVEMPVSSNLVDIEIMINRTTRDDAPDGLWVFSSMTVFPAHPTHLFGRDIMLSPKLVLVFKRHLWMGIALGAKGEYDTTEAESQIADSDK